MKEGKAFGKDWERREMRRHSIHQWLVLLVELALIAATIAGIVWIFRDVHP